MTDESTLGEQDWQMLDMVDQALAVKIARGPQDDSLYGTCAYLAQAGPRPSEMFTQTLEDRVMATWEHSRTASAWSGAMRSRRRFIQSSLDLLLAPYGRYSLARSLVAALLALGLLVGLAATAWAVYVKVVVAEPSFDVASLDKAAKHAQFSVWVSGQGQLVRVYTLGNPDGFPWEYSIVLDYRLQDERRYSVIQSKARPDFNLQQYYAESQQQDPNHMRILNWDVDINHSHGVLYQIRGDLVAPPPSGFRPWETRLHWQVEGTDLTLNENAAYPLLSPEDMAAIARSMRMMKR